MRNTLLILMALLVGNIAMVAQDNNTLAPIDSCAIEACDTISESLYADEKYVRDTIADSATELFVIARDSKIIYFDNLDRILMLPGETDSIQESRSGVKYKIVAQDSTNVEIEVNRNWYYQLVLLDENLFALITTHAIPQQDSEIEFFDFKWDQLPTKKFFKVPELRDWLTDSGKKNIKEVEKKVPFLIVYYKYNPTTKILTLTNNLKDYFIVNEWNELAPFFKSELKYEWSKKKFKQIK